MRGEAGLGRPVVVAARGEAGAAGPSPRRIAPALARRALMLLAVVLALFAERADRLERAEATDSCSSRRWWWLWWWWEEEGGC